VQAEPAVYCVHAVHCLQAVHAVICVHAVHCMHGVHTVHCVQVVHYVQAMQAAFCVHAVQTLTTTLTPTNPHPNFNPKHKPLTLTMQTVRAAQCVQVVHFVRARHAMYLLQSVNCS